MIFYLYGVCHEKEHPFAIGSHSFTGKIIQNVVLFVNSIFFWGGEHVVLFVKVHEENT